MRSTGKIILLLGLVLSVPGYGAKPDTSGNGVETENDYQLFKKRNPVFIVPETANTFRKGDFFCIELETNPSTGYDWFYVISSKGKQPVTAVEDRYFSLGRKKMAGSPFRRIIRFQASLPGDAVIIFKYYRPWEKGKGESPGKKYQVKVR